MPETIVWKLSRRQIIRFLLLSAGMSLCLPLHAQLYKWVDEDGNVNYTQSPPPAGVEASTLRPPAPVNDMATQERLRYQAELADRLNEQRQARVEQTENTKRKQEQDMRLCEQAKARLASYERPRVSVQQPDGSSRILGEEERQHEIQRSQDLVRELCR